MVDKKDSKRLYQYPLSPPLAFQAGDILGYFQGASSMSQLRLLSEDVGSGHLQYFRNISANNPDTQTEDCYQPLIYVETGEPMTYTIKI